MNIIPFLIIVLSAGGFGVAYYIRCSKQKKHPMVCSVGHDCNAVVASNYNSVFGIPLEVIGMIFYTAVVILTLLSIFWEGTVFSFEMPQILLIFGSVGLLVSIILTAIQGLVLKEWCQYCLMSAFISFLLFALEFIYVVL